jgi:hypothetical protein
VFFCGVALLPGGMDLGHPRDRRVY